MAPPKSYATLAHTTTAGHASDSPSTCVRVLGKERCIPQNRREKKQLRVGARLTLPPAKNWPPADFKAFSTLAHQLHEGGETDASKDRQGRGRIRARVGM